MLGSGGSLFIQIPIRSKVRILHPAKVVALEDNIYTVQLEEEHLPLSDGQDVVVFYADGREFMKQIAEIGRVYRDGLARVVEFKPTGKPVSAESRQFYRVTTIAEGLTAGLGTENSCPLLDVSWRGFSVIAPHEDFNIGNIVNAALRHQGEKYMGKVCVQSIRKLSKRRTRYGLLCVEDERSTGDMPKGLHRMTVSLEREQLRRLAGNTPATT